MPVTRGIMRNSWFPTKIAEYVTVGKLQEPGKDGIEALRDPTFGSRRVRKAEMAAQRAASFEADLAAEASAVPRSTTETEFPTLSVRV